MSFIINSRNLGKRVLRPAVTLAPSEVSPPDSSEEDLWLLEVPYSSQEPKYKAEHLNDMRAHTHTGKWTM